MNPCGSCFAQTDPWTQLSRSSGGASAISALGTVCQFHHRGDYFSHTLRQRLRPGDLPGSDGAVLVAHNLPYSPMR